ncbi:hypothetical protein KUTeg_023142 [Tegillarca granosa]|uniref:Uncharacterized protein n=1 Tax=Tegillarca granosa TaxID=220873 RepID=A0ABQ9E6B2_TEGGR|nr:hypothetical protein KUTeg_023142 [Tegillarca granosa]
MTALLHNQLHTKIYQQIFQSISYFLDDKHLTESNPENHNCWLLFLSPQMKEPYPTAMSLALALNRPAMSAKTFIKENAPHIIPYPNPETENREY